jgi:ABC-2 type transport system permease protein
VSATRSEEADGYLDNLLARRVGRGNWLAGRLAFAAALAALCGLATAAGGWLGLAVTGAGGEIGIVAMLEAGFNVMVLALFVLGIGAFLYGLVPRIAVPALYAFILWSFVIVLIGSSVTTNRWLLDTALLTHLGPVPATGLHWAAIAWMGGIAVAASAAGFLMFRRRDLAGA